MGFQTKNNLFQKQSLIENPNFIPFVGEFEFSFEVRGHSSDLLHHLRMMLISYAGEKFSFYLHIELMEFLGSGDSMSLHDIPWGPPP